MYKVVKDFTDKTDKHIYRAGDAYPRKGVKADEARIKELSSKENKRGEILIKEVKEQKKSKAKAKEDKE